MCKYFFQQLHSKFFCPFYTLPDFAKYSNACYKILQVSLFYLFIRQYFPVFFLTILFYCTSFLLQLLCICFSYCLSIGLVFMFFCTRFVTSHTLSLMGDERKHLFCYKDKEEGIVQEAFVILRQPRITQAAPKRAEKMKSSRTRYPLEQTENTRCVRTILTPVFSSLNTPFSYW